MLLSIDYPNSWRAQELNAPDGVQRFVSEDGEGLEFATLSIIDKEAEAQAAKATPAQIEAIRSLTEDQLGNGLTPKLLVKSLPAGSELLETRLLQVAGTKAGLLRYSTRVEKNGNRAVIQNASYHFFWERKLITLSFRFVADADRPEALPHKEILMQSLTQKILESIRLGRHALQAAAEPAAESGNPAEEFRRGARTRFRTADHAKAQGLDLSVEYPNSWEAREDPREQIVQLFGRHLDHGTVSMMLMILDLGISAQDRRNEFGSEEEFARHAVANFIKDPTKIVSKRSRILKVRETLLDGQPTAFSVTRERSEQANEMIAFETQTFAFVREGKLVLVTLTCGGREHAPDEAALDQLSAEYAELFKLMANSLIVHRRIPAQ